MIERQTINGKDATVMYFDPGFTPTDKDTAMYVSVHFDDGDVIMLTTAQPGSPGFDDEPEPDVDEPSDDHPKPPADPPAYVQLGAWQKAVMVLDASEVLVRDIIERELVAIARMRVSSADVQSITDRLMRKVTKLRVHAIKVAFRLLRARLGDDPVLDKSLAGWAQYFAREDIKNIRTAISTGLIAGLDNTEIARKVVGSMGLNGVDGVTEFTRHKIGHLGRAAIKASIMRKKNAQGAASGIKPRLDARRGIWLTGGNSATAEG